MRLATRGKNESPFTIGLMRSGRTGDTASTVDVFDENSASDLRLVEVKFLSTPFVHALRGTTSCISLIRATYPIRVIVTLKINHFIESP